MVRPERGKEGREVREEIREKKSWPGVLKLGGSWEGETEEKMMKVNHERNPVPSLQAEVPSLEHLLFSGNQWRWRGLCLGQVVVVVVASEEDQLRHSRPAKSCLDNGLSVNTRYRTELSLCPA